jgi:hypothetical protein
MNDRTKTLNQTNGWSFDNEEFKKGFPMYTKNWCKPFMFTAEPFSFDNTEKISADERQSYKPFENFGLFLVF